MFFEQLSAAGFALLPGFLTPAECREIRAMYDQPERFRSRIDMKRYRFGQGEYQYFQYPLPARIASLRSEWYEQLAPAANQWQGGREYPPAHAEFLRICEQAGQPRPTPLLLRYRAGDFNCLHQDLYGDVYFPFQIVVCLSEPGVEFTGGELLLVEQQPRAQSIGRVVPLARQGDAAIIATRYRLGRNARGGTYRANIRHGVSEIRGGERYTLGIVFHDAA